MKTWAEEIGANIRRQRKEAGVGFRELARRISHDDAGFNSQMAAIGRYESGKRLPGVVQLMRIARAIGCELQALLEGVDP